MKYTREALITDESGQGEVYRGRDENGRAVAIKYLKVSSAEHEATKDRKRFAREVACQRDLAHPNIVTVLGARLKGDRPFYVMPLADGSLRDLLAFHPGGMPEDMVLDLILPVTRAIAFAHRNGVIHRDLKPENILMYGDTPRVSDFGLGRRLASGSTTVTMTHVGLGTLNYSAPEQLEDGHSADERCDIYSVGRMIFEMLSGRRPFMQLDLSLIPPRFRNVVYRSTAHDPKDRFQSMRALRHELKLLSEGSDRVRSPLSRASALLGAISAGNETPEDLTALETVLIENSEDAALYEEFIKSSNEQLLVALFERSRSAFRTIFTSVDRFSDSNRFDFDFTDELADRLCEFYWVDEEISTRSAVLRRLLALAYGYNRYYVRDRFVALAVNAISDETYSPIVAGLLRDTPDAKPFVERQMRKHSLPPVVAAELAA
ncbi:serine/threonine-protein kinase [Leifsonia aquatica]|uniref:serine/threonine-protein kinase n=1 Tax=Leifsonia aquatica TaxID=144185 RepID=UPI0028A7C444|nr:serine/threonine-protein kinase [Leifsonia aquatica]